MNVRSVLFVCTGNICRSPLAHALLEVKLKELGRADIIVESGGMVDHHVGENADARMRETAHAHGVTVDHPARLVTHDDLSSYDLIVAMDDGHVRRLSRMTGGRSANLVKMRSFDPEVSGEHAPDVPDPWYGGMDGFEKVYQMVDRSTAALAEQIVQG